MRAWKMAAQERWAIEAAALDQLLEIAGRENDKSPLAIAAKEGRPLQFTRTATTRDGVATIPVTGPIFRYANLFTEFSGATSLAVLATDLDSAVKNPDVRAIILEINSPGGQVTGLAEFADQVRAAAAVKTVVAYVDGSASSAAYWIAAAASRIVMSKTAHAGSIGVVAIYVDDKPKEGTGAYRFVSSQSPNKRVDPATDEGAASIQAELDELATIFIDAVAAFRGVSADDVVGKFGAGGTLLGAAAVAAGMADEIGSFEGLHKELATNPVRSPASGTGAHNLLTTKETSMSELTVEAVKKEHPATAAALIAEGAAAERERLNGIDANILPGYEKLAKECKDDPACTPEAAAVRQVQASKDKGSKYLDVQRQNEQGLPKVPVAGAPDPAPKDKTAAELAAEEAKLPLEERCKARWDRDEALRAEFADSFTGYLAYAKADASGQVKIYGKKE